MKHCPVPTIWCLDILVISFYFKGMFALNFETASLTATQISPILTCIYSVPQILRSDNVKSRPLRGLAIFSFRFQILNLYFLLWSQKVILHYHRKQYMVRTMSTLWQFHSGSYQIGQTSMLHEIDLFILTMILGVMTSTSPFFARNWQLLPFDTGWEHCSHREHDQPKGRFSEQSSIFIRPNH